MGKAPRLPSKHPFVVERRCPWVRCDLDGTPRRMRTK